MKRERLLSLTLAAAALVGVTACSEDTTAPDTSSTHTTTATPTTSPGTGADGTVGPPARPQAFGPGRLSFFGDCTVLLDYMKAAATERVTAWGLGGGGVRLDEAAGRVETAADLDDSAPAAEPTAGSDRAASYSGTNTQEIGVDEGDVVETDGEYVYVGSADAVRIVAVDGAEVVEELELPQGAHQLLLTGDRLLVTTTSWSGSPDTIVSVFDVTDPGSSALLRRSHLEGAVVATRAIDGVARLVITTSFDQRLPFVQPSQFGLDEESALVRNKEIIAESTVEDWLPRTFDENGDGSFGPMDQILACEDVAAPADFSGLGLTWIASIDNLGEAVPVGSAGIVSTGSTVYASTDNLYVATQNWDWQWGRPVPLVEEAAGAGTDPATTPTASATPAPSATTAAPAEPDGPPPTLIHQFSLGAGTEASYVASGEVEGRLLNQFAMSEHNGDLRVATTTDNWGNFGDQSESTVYVLRPDGDDLEQISSISGLGKGEQIYAVRFLDDVAYVVTFRQVDPLYVIDLSDPQNPVLDGELKIPGYSAYLHPVGDGLVLGVGQDATTEGRTTGTQMSLFDVSDPTNPQLVNSLPIGGHSDVEWDHKAFLFWEPDGTIVIPVSPGWSDCGPVDTCLAKEIAGSGGGAIVAQLNGRELTSRGVISHGDAQRGCWNPLQRSMIIGEEIVTVGLDQLRFSERASLETRDVVTWGDPDEFGCSWYVE